MPISNCINSGIYRVAVLTQFNSVSLHRHIARTYIFDTFHRGYVQVLAAEQTASSEAWYQGTADAVRKQLLEIRSSNCEYVLDSGGRSLVPHGLRGAGAISLGTPGRHHGGCAAGAQKKRRHALACSNARPMAASWTLWKSPKTPPC